MEYYVELILEEYGKLDIFTDNNDLGISLTYKIDDIKDFASRSSSYSKSINLPGTDRNNKILKNIFDIRNNSDFDMTAKHNCKLLLNKNPIISGYFILKNIKKLYKDNNKAQIVYEVVIYDDIKNFFEDLGEKKLSELDFSSGFTFNGINYTKGNHIFNEQYIYNTYKLKNWDFRNVYCYPVVDYGYNIYGGTGFTSGTGTTFMNRSYPRDISLGLLAPAVFHKAIIDRIFYEAGWTYNSDYLDGVTYDGFFKNLVNLYNKKQRLTDIKLCEYVVNGYVQTAIEQAIPFRKINNISISGITTNYMEVDGYFKTGFSYQFYAGGSPIGSVINGDGGIEILEDGLYKLRMVWQIQKDMGGYTSSVPGANYNYSTWYSWNIIETNTHADRVVVNSVTSSVPPYSNIGPPTQNPFTFEIIADDIQLKKGQIINGNIRKGRWNTGGGWQYIPEVWVGGITFELYKKETSKTFVDKYGTELTLADYLPDMTQADFIKEHIKVANLYIWRDKDNDKILNIEPRNDFYENSTIVNWTKKVDYSKEIKITSLLEDISGNDYIFKYSDGSDYYSRDYIETYNETYGTYEYTYNSPLVDGEVETELLWQSYQQHTIQKGKKRYLVPLLGENADDTFFTESSLVYEPLMAFYTKIQSAFPIYMKLGGTVGSPASKFSKNPQLLSYPQASHTVVLGGNSYDLNWQTSHPLFSMVDYDIDRNIYNIFWENYIDTLLNRNSRKCEIYINLDLQDILRLDFQQRILIDGQVYYLQSVQYDPMNFGSHKVILLKEITPIEFANIKSCLLLKNNIEYVTQQDKRLVLVEPPNKRKMIEYRIIIC